MRYEYGFGDEIEQHGKAMLQQGISQGIEQGISQGIEQGISQGIEQGMSQGESQLLQRLLTKRFGVIPADIAEKIKSASTQDHEHWGERLLDAPTLQAVFH